MSGLVEWAVFLSLAAVAVASAAGMLLTMSMYRAGLSLMASFLALAGLFVLLDADLLAAIQVMMNVGGMLVMILFMVMIMMDPGGEMMWDMKRKMRLPGPGALSMRMPGGEPTSEEPAHPMPDPHAPAREGGGEDWTCPMHREIRSEAPGSCPKCGMDLVPASQTDEADAHAHEAHAMHNHANTGETGMGDMKKMGGMAMAGMGARQHHRMMVDMAMSTTQLPWALVVGALASALLIGLAVWTPWPLAPIGPTRDSTSVVGELLLSRYMIGFEGAAFLILAGIVAAVVFSARDRGSAAPPQGGDAHPGDHA